SPYVIGSESAVKAIASGCFRVWAEIKEGIKWLESQTISVRFQFLIFSQSSISDFLSEADSRGGTGFNCAELPSFAAAVAPAKGHKPVKPGDIVESVFIIYCVMLLTHPFLSRRESVSKDR